MITADVAERILSGATRVSLDLGLSFSDITVVNDSAELLGVKVTLDDLVEITSKGNSVFFPEGGYVFQVAISSGRFYKLVPTASAPTLEIDGVRMHRTKDTTPDKDTEAKLGVLGLVEGRVLDTCMGLGYTAIGALNRGATVVVSVERDSSVVRIAHLNPWSSRLFEGDIRLILGDSFLTLNALPAGFFDWVIHDPPRLTHAGSLYSEEFYRKLYRVMAVGGKLFHYTGEPRSRYRGVNLQRGVQQRLKEAGFKGTDYHASVMGVTCKK